MNRITKNATEREAITIRLMIAGKKDGNISVEKQFVITGSRQTIEIIYNCVGAIPILKEE